MTASREPRDTREALIKTLEEKSGVPLSDWVELVRTGGPDSGGAAVTWLEIEHGLGRPHAELITEEAFGGTGARKHDNPAMQLEAMYADQKAELRPLRDSLADLILGLGSDVDISPEASYESVRRGREFAVIKPVARPAPGRILLGLSLPGTDFAGRPRKVMDTGGSEHITHEIVIKNETEIDDDLLMWLRKAYNLAA